MNKTEVRDTLPLYCIVLSFVAVGKQLGFDRGKELSKGDLE
jgi:hypothetical protein